MALLFLELNKRSIALVTATSFSSYITWSVLGIAQYKGDNNGKNGDDSKPKDKDNNTIGTAGAHVGKFTAPKAFTAPSDGSTISAHVSKVAEHKF